MESNVSRETLINTGFFRSTETHYLVVCVNAEINLDMVSVRVTIATLRICEKIEHGTANFPTNNGKPLMLALI